MGVRKGYIDRSMESDEDFNERMRVKSLKYYQKNRKAILLKTKTQKARLKNSIAHKKYYIKNRDKIIEQTKKYKKSIIIKSYSNAAYSMTKSKRKYICDNASDYVKQRLADIKKQQSCE